MSRIKIGPIIGSLEFSKDEKVRIVGQLKLGGRHNKIFLDYGQKTDRFKREAKHIKIPGHSKGRLAHAKKALNIVFNDLTEGGNKNEGLCWEIYGEAIADYVRNEQKFLHKLMIEIEVDDKEYSSTDMLKIVCENAKRYEVNVESIRELYELWGFERVDNLDEILLLCGKSDSEEIEKISTIDAENIIDSPEVGSIEEVLDWDNSTKELVNISKKISKGKPDKIKLEKLLSLTNNLIALANKEEEKNQVINGINNFLDQFEKDLSVYRKNVGLAWINKSLVSQVIDTWNDKISKTREKDLPEVLEAIQKSKSNTDVELKTYSNHEEKKRELNVKISKLDSSLSDDTETRRKGRKKIKELRSELIVIEEALTNIEDNLTDIASHQSCKSADRDDGENDSYNQSESELEAQSKIKTLSTVTNDKELLSQNETGVLRANKSSKKKDSPAKSHSRENSDDTTRSENKISSTVVPVGQSDEDRTCQIQSNAPENIVAQSFLDTSVSESYRNNKCQSDVFWLLIKKGYPNYAYWFIKALEDSGILGDGLPPSSLVKAFAYAGKMTNGYDESAIEYYEVIKELDLVMLEGLMKDDSEECFAIRSLVVASMFLPAFFIPTLPGQYLKITTRYFPTQLYDFINDICDFFKVPIDPLYITFVGKLKTGDIQGDLVKIQKNLASYKKAPRESGWKYWKLPAKKLMESEPFNALFLAIETNNTNKVLEVAKVIETYKSDKSLDNLLQDTHRKQNSRHKCSHHTIKEVKGVPRQQFLQLFNDIFENARNWVNLCITTRSENENPQKNKFNTFVKKLRTKVPQIHKNLQNIFPEVKGICGHAGITLLETCFEDVERLISGKFHSENLDSGKWFQFPNSLEVGTEVTEIPLLALRIAKVLKSNFDIREEWGNCLNSGDFGRVDDIYAEYCRTKTSEKVLLGFESERKSSLKKWQKNGLNRVELVSLDLVDSYMQTIIDDYDYGELSSDIGLLREEIEINEQANYPLIYRKLDEIEHRLVVEKSERLDELRRYYEFLKERTDSNGSLSGNWKANLEVAFDSNNVSLAEEILNQYEESLENSDLSMSLDFNAGRSILREFLGKEKEIYEFFSDQKPSKHIIISIKEAIKNKRPFGPLTFSRDQKVVLDAFKGWNSLNGHNRKAKLSLSERSHLWVILDSLGFLPVSSAHFSTEQVQNQMVVLKAKLIIPRDGSPIPHFGSLSEGRYNIALTWGKSFSEIFDSLENCHIRHETEPVILFIFNDLSIEERREFSHYCNKNSVSVLLVDRIVFIFIMSLGESPTESRLRISFNATLPFSFNNPYAEAGRPPPAEMIFGRREEIKDVLDPTGPAMVYGGRQLGKSTILKEARERFHDPEENRYGVPGDSLNDDFTNYRGEVLNKKVSEDFWNKIGKAFKAADLLPDMEIYSQEVVRELLMNDKSINVLITFDEVDKFLDLDFQNEFRTCSDLRQLTQDTEFRFKVVMAGLANVQRYARIPNFPLTQLGAPLAVGMMRTSDALSLIREPLASVGYFIDERAAYQILAYTNRHPGLIQVFCHNLIKRLSDRVSTKEIESPGYNINESEVRKVYQDSKVQGYIKERFRWTLNLDPYWATLAYGLCINGMEKTEIDVLKAKSVGEEYWPQGFQLQTLTVLETILNEMVCLGILIIRGNKYRLRSHNVKHLLGSQDEMYEELCTVVQEFKKDSTSDRHRAFKNLERKEFSPLTIADEISFLNSSGANQSSGHNTLDAGKYSLASIFGSDALGLSALSRAMDTIGEFEGFKQRYTVVPLKQGKLKDYSGYINGIDSRLKANRDRPIILMIEMPGSSVSQEDHIKIFNYLVSLRTKKHNVNTRVVCLFGPEACWEWIGLKDSSIYEDGNTTLLLSRWNEASVKNFIVSAGLRSGKENIDFMMKKTGGWFSHLSGFLDMVKGNTDEPRLIKGVDRKFPVAPSRKHCKEQLTAIGLFSVPFAFPLLLEFIKAGCENDVSVPGLELVGEKVVLENPELAVYLSSDKNRILEWFLRMGVIELSENSGEDKESFEGGYKIETLTKLFLKGVDNNQP
jgi:hypothetical protein